VNQIETPALVLHTFDYRETSRIVRIVTRDAGVLSVVARGARRPRNKFGAALDLFASGVAQVTMHGTRDLHALHGFDATRSRRELAESLDKFGAASAVAEFCIRFGHDSETGHLFGAAEAALDAIAAADAVSVPAVAVANAWRLVAELGFAPTLSQCASCHAGIAADADVTFAHRAGGALCAACARRAPGGRRVPAEARATLTAWLSGVESPADGPAIRSHLRLLREFLEEHLGDGRPLRALIAWEERQQERPAIRVPRQGVSE
jgi:DNA repair protein RecO (recombination protein O)